MRSNPAHMLSFTFQLENILRSNSNFSNSYGRFTDLKALSGLLLVSFYGLEKKISQKYSLIGGGRLSPCPDGVDIAYAYGISFDIKASK